MSADDAFKSNFTKHSRGAYVEDAGNPTYPNAIRVAFLAYGHHRANGHARFKSREIANVLGSFDEIGTFVPASKYAVQRAINTAIEWGLLDPTSKALCLVVPGHRIRGHLGDIDAPCDRHATRKGAASRAVPSAKGADTPALSPRKGAVPRTDSRPKGAALRAVSGSDPSFSSLLPLNATHHDTETERTA